MSDIADQRQQRRYIYDAAVAGKGQGIYLMFEALFAFIGKLFSKPAPPPAEVPIVTENGKELITQTGNKKIIK